MKKSIKSKKTRKTDLMTFNRCKTEGKVAALYVRVSDNEKLKTSSGTEDRASVETQKQDLIAYATDPHRNWNYEIYDNDSELSGFSDDLDREDLQRLIDDIKNDKIHTIVVRDLKRLARNAHLQSRIIHEVCWPHGVAIEALTEHVDITTADGLLMAGIKGNRNQEELAYIAKRSMRSKKHLAEQGKLRTTPPLGYGIQEIDGIRELYIRKEEEKIVKELFRRYTTGESTMNIRDSFEARGLRTKRGPHWHLANMNRILRNPRYVGLFLYNDELHQSPFPPIIDRSMWDEAQKILDANETGGRRRNSKHLMSGLLICGNCRENKEKDIPTPYLIHERYVAALGKTWRKDASGTNKRANYPVYRCQTKMKFRAASCPDSPSLVADDIESFIRHYIARYIESGSSETSNTSAQTRELKSQLNEVHDEKEAIESRMNSVVAKVLSGQVSAEMLAKIEGEARKKQRQIDTEIARLKRQLEAITNQEAKNSLTLLESWDQFDTVELRKNLARVIRDVVVWPGRLVIRTQLNPERPTTIRLNKSRIAPEWWQKKALRIKLTVDMPGD